MISQPLAFGSHKSKLIRAIREGPCSKRVTLNPEEWLRLVVWIDANAPYHDTFINTRENPPPYDVAADRGLIDRLSAIHANRCASCHKADEVTRTDWIDLRRPATSRFLTAPLARTVGGAGKCSRPVYLTRDDPDYRSTLDLVQTAAREAWQRPRRDLRAGLSVGRGQSLNARHVAGPGGAARK